MATNKTQNKSPSLKMGQLWTQVDDNLTADEDDTEEEDDVNRDNNETMKLRREDMSLFGICPAWDQFYLVVCEYCKQVIKPQALQQHIELRHSYHKHISNKQINNSLKLRTDSTNATTIMPSIRRTSSTTTTIVAANGSDINSNNDNNNKLVNKVAKSDVKVMLSSTNSAKSVDNKTNSFNNNSVVVVVDNSVDTNCVESSNELIETYSSNTKPNSKLINLLSPNVSTTIEPLVPEPTGPGPGPGFTPLVSADINSVTISVPEIDLNNRIEMSAKEPDLAIVEMVPKAAKKKSYKKSSNPRKLLPCKDRLYDPNKHCGVCVPDVDKPCTRSLTCKTHSLTLRRAVKGRIKNFDELLSEHREAKEAALRAQGIEVKPTKKAIQRQQQQLRASQLQLKVEQSQQLMSDKSNCQPMPQTLVLSDPQSVVSNAMTNSNTNSLLTLVTSPVCSSIENVRTREPEVLPKQTHLKLNQIEVDSNGSVYMRCHPIPAAVCNFNIRTLGHSRLLSRSHDLTLAALRSTFNSPISVSKLANNQKCSSTLTPTPTPLSVKSPLRNPNQSYSPNKKLCTSIDSESRDSWTDSQADPYNFADNISFTYVKPKTKSASNPTKKKKKSDSNCSNDNSSLLSNGQLFHTSNANKSIGSTAKKKNIIKKNANNSHNISATIPLTISNNNIISATNSNCEQVINPSTTSLISEVPNVQHRNLNEFLSNSIDSCKSDNGSILLNGSLLNSCRRSNFTALSKPTNSDLKDSINRKTIFSAKSFNNNNKYLVNSLSPTLSSISSALSVNPNSRQLIQKQTLPSSAVNTLSQSQNMSNMSQISQNIHNIHNTTHTIFIKSAKQSLQNQLIPTINSPKLLSKTEDYTT